MEIGEGVRRLEARNCTLREKNAALLADNERLAKALREFLMHEPPDCADQDAFDMARAALDAHRSKNDAD